MKLNKICKIEAQLSEIFKCRNLHRFNILRNRIQIRLIIKVQLVCSDRGAKTNFSFVPFFSYQWNMWLSLKRMITCRLYLFFLYVLLQLCQLFNIIIWLLALLSGVFDQIFNRAYFCYNNFSIVQWDFICFSWEMFWHIIDKSHIWTGHILSVRIQRYGSVYSTCTFAPICFFGSVWFLNWEQISMISSNSKMFCLDCWKCYFAEMTPICFSP